MCSADASAHRKRTSTKTEHRPRQARDLLIGLRFYKVRPEIWAVPAQLQETKLVLIPDSKICYKNPLGF